MPNCKRSSKISNRNRQQDIDIRISNLKPIQVRQKVVNIEFKTKKGRALVFKAIETYKK